MLNISQPKAHELETIKRLAHEGTIIWETPNGWKSESDFTSRVERSLKRFMKEEFDGNFNFLIILEKK